MKAKLALLALLTFGVAQAAEAPQDWRPVDPQNLVLLDVTYGRVALELAPQFAPKAVARFKALIRAHFYDGKSFYRVIDGFVAQGGIGEDSAATAGSYSPQVKKRWPPLPAEFDVAAPNRVWVTDITYIRTYEGWLFWRSCSTCSRGR